MPINQIVFNLGWNRWTSGLSEMKIKFGVLIAFIQKYVVVSSVYSRTPL